MITQVLNRERHKENPRTRTSWGLRPFSTVCHLLELSFYSLKHPMPVLKVARAHSPTVITLLGNVLVLHEPRAHHCVLHRIVFFTSGSVRCIACCQLLSPGGDFTLHSDRSFLFLLHYRPELHTANMQAGTRTRLAAV